MHKVFQLQAIDLNNQPVKLDQFLQNTTYLLIYLYPKDNTLGCTKEAIGFSQLKPQFDQLNTYIVGISKDSPTSHQRFIQKHNLKITLLSDPDHKIIGTLGAWQLKKLAGRTYYGTVRSSFLFDNTGKLIHSWLPVKKAATHPQEVLDYLQQLTSS